MGSQFDSLASGEQPEALAALRSVTANALTEAEPREVAPLVTAFLRVLEAQAQVRPVAESRVDDLTSQRQARLSRAQTAVPADVGGVVGRPGSG